MTGLIQNGLNDRSILSKLFIKNLNTASQAYNGWSGTSFPKETLAMNGSSNDGFIYARFLSDGSVEKQGFVIHWSCQKTTQEYTSSRLL